jgi:hypothetical protein
MDLAVVGDGLAAHHHGVVRRAAGALEHAGHDRRASFGGHPRHLGSERAVDRLGHLGQAGAGLAEVARERLGQHHQVRVVGDEVGQTGPVDLRVEARRLLDQHDLHAPSLPRSAAARLAG